MTTQTYDARDFAATWLSVSQAASTDKDSNLMYRAVHLEVWLDVGVRMSATDRYMGLTAWLPVYDNTDAPPDLDDADLAMIAKDPDLRAKSLMRYAMKSTKHQVADEWVGHEAELVLDLNADNPDDDQPEIEELASRWVSYGLPGRELVVCPTIDAPYPSIARLVRDSGPPTPVDMIAANPTKLAAIAGVERYHPGSHLVARFRGSSPQIVATMSGSHPEVTGVLAPITAPDDEDGDAA